MACSAQFVKGTFEQRLETPEGKGIEAEGMGQAVQRPGEKTVSCWRNSTQRPVWLE